MSWIWLLVTFLLGTLGGYILKDQTTDEFKSEVTIRRPKVKGRQNRMDLDQVVEVTAKKLTMKQRRAARKAKRNNS